LFSNFIDVSQQRDHLDEEDILERTQKYVKHLSEIPTTTISTTLYTPYEVPNTSIFDMIDSETFEDIIDILSHAIITTNEMELVNKYKYCIISTNVLFSL
jgi:hypothetical protein